MRAPSVWNVLHSDIRDTTRSLVYFKNLSLNYYTLTRKYLQPGRSKNIQISLRKVPHNSVSSIERIQKRVLRIIYPKLDYDQAITETKLQTLEERRDDLCVSLIKKMLEPNHKLHSLLPKKLKDIRQKETRTSSQKLYNFPSKTERFKHSPLVYCIYLYNSRLVN